jgi:cytochrome c2
VNGWDWVAEGQRIAEETRRIGEVDIASIKANSLVFEGPMDHLKAAEIGATETEPAPKVGGLAGDLADIVREVELCRAGHCEAAYAQNSKGGEARDVVGQIAKAAGVTLSSAFIRPLGGDVWSPANMARALTGVQELVAENQALRDELAARDQKSNSTAQALRKALADLEEGV